jgi:hypothetical protein
MFFVIWKKHNPKIIRVFGQTLVQIPTVNLLVLRIEIIYSELSENECLLFLNAYDSKGTNIVLCYI